MQQTLDKMHVVWYNRLDALLMNRANATLYDKAQRVSHYTQKEREEKTNAIRETAQHDACREEERDNTHTHTQRDNDSAHNQ